MISVSNISKAYGSRILFSAVTFNVGVRDRIAVVGPNGSGKTTLFEIMTEKVTPDSGSITMRKGTTVGPGVPARPVQHSPGHNQICRLHRLPRPVCVHPTISHLQRPGRDVKGPCSRTEDVDTPTPIR